MDNRNFEVEWKFAKFNYFLGKHTTDEKESEKAFEDGVQAGRIASRVEPNKPDGYFWYGANLGEQAKKSPVTVGIKSIDDIREAMNKVIEIQPDYQAASAYDALAQIELKAGLMAAENPKKRSNIWKRPGNRKRQSLIFICIWPKLIWRSRPKAEAKKQLDIF